MKIRILHMINSLAVGGAEKLLVGIINDLEGFEHHIMLLRGPDTLLSEIKVPYQLVNLECDSFTRLLLTRIGTINKYIRQNRIEIVHSHLFESNIMSRLATPRKIPVINSIHAISSLASYKANRLAVHLERFSYKKRHVQINVSKAVRDDFDHWVGIKGDAHILYNFIEDRFFVAPTRTLQPTGSLKLVAVGNLRAQKNYPYLVEAFRQMPPGVQLDIFGEGDLRESLQKEIDKYNLNIRLMGVRNDLEKILPGYDAFVMSSFFEGQPVSLLEAAACGVPALLSDIPVLREVLEEDALYFDIQDPANLVQLVKEILEQKHDLGKLSKGAADRVEKFARKRHYMQKLTGIYKQYLQQERVQQLLVT